MPSLRTLAFLCTIRLSQRRQNNKQHYSAAGAHIESSSSFTRGLHNPSAPNSDSVYQLCKLTGSCAIRDDRVSTCCMPGRAFGYGQILIDCWMGHSNPSMGDRYGRQLVGTSITGRTKSSKVQSRVTHSLRAVTLDCRSSGAGRSDEPASGTPARRLCDMANHW
jgi:hypothetical protein